MHHKISRQSGFRCETNLIIERVLFTEWNVSDYPSSLSCILSGLKFLGHKCENAIRVWSSTHLNFEFRMTLDASLTAAHRCRTTSNFSSEKKNSQA